MKPFAVDPLLFTPFFFGGVGFWAVAYLTLKRRLDDSFSAQKQGRASLAVQFAALVLFGLTLGAWSSVLGEAASLFGWGLMGGFTLLWQDHVRKRTR